MAWSCFSSAKTCPLVNVKGNMDQKLCNNILVHHARPTLQSEDNSYFLHNNDPKRTVKFVIPYLNGKRFPSKLLDWSSQSQNMSPIENF